MTIYKCVNEDCGQIVLSNESPEPLKWSNGHVCSYIEFKPPEEFTRGEGITRGTQAEAVRALDRRHEQIKRGGGDLR